MNTTLKPTRYLQSLNAALNVLDLLRGQSEAVGVTEVARRLQMSKATVHGILTNLEARGFVLRNGDTHSYRLGRHLWRLGLVAGSQIELKQLCSPHLHELTRTTGESSLLAEYCSIGNVLYLEHVSGPNPIQAYVKMGVLAPIFDYEENAVAAIGVSGPSYRFTKERAKRIAVAVKRAASDISAELGYKKRADSL